MTSLRRGGAAVALAALLIIPAVPARAFAYCRTITTPIDPAYTPTPQSGCYEPPGSLFVWWRNACVGYSLQKDASRQVSLADAETTAARAFSRWSGATCASGGHPSITAQTDGPVDCAAVEYSEAGPNQHVIVFRDGAWPHSDPNNTLALTTVTFDKNTGELYDADMEINTAQNKVVLTGPASGGAFDLDSIVTHEAGHFLGLAHSTDASAVMFAHYNPGSVELTQDDVAGICVVYDPSGARATRKLEADGTTVTPVAVAAEACDSTPRHGFGTACGPVGPVTPSATKGCTISTRAGAGSRDANVALGISLLAVAFAIGRRRSARLSA